MGQVFFKEIFFVYGKRLISYSLLYLEARCDVRVGEVVQERMGQ
jgi:hypothetical protein